MFVRYWLMKLFRIHKGETLWACVFTAGPDLEQGVFASRPILELSYLLSTFAFLDLYNLEKEWLTSSYYWAAGKIYL